MSLLAFWAPPLDEDVTRIIVHRAESATGRFDEVANLRATDPYGNWVTHYLDPEPSVTDARWYRAVHMKEGDLHNLVVAEVSGVSQGEVPYQVTPDMVLDQAQGLPLNFIRAELIQRHIGWTLAGVESHIRQRLRPTSVQLEDLPANTWRRIAGDQIGKRIRLRHFPVISVEQFYYRVRSSFQPAPVAFEGLDVQVENTDQSTGFNRGGVTVWPRQTSLSSILAGLQIPEAHIRGAIKIFVDYTHGWQTWPGDLEMVITQWVAREIMEISANTESPGLSMRSVDGYQETYTASATTSQFSALRLYYEQQAKTLLAPYKKGLFA